MKILHTKIPPPVYALLVAAAMYWLNLHLPLVVVFERDWRFLAWVLGGPGLGLDLWALGRFFKAKTTALPMHPHKSTHLVVSGPYRFTRNPMYLGLALQLAAWAWWLGSLSPWLLLPVFVLLINEMQIKPEERALLLIFGDDYRRYCETVHRWLGQRR